MVYLQSFSTGWKMWNHSLVQNMPFITTDKELWEAKDSVVVINQAGEILNTEQLFWDERNKIIYSEQFC
jgi:hypothetical protein